MSKDPWIKWFPGDFLHGVSELEANEGWVYTIVLNLIYDAGGPWPLSVDRLSRRCRLRPSTVEKVLGTLYDLGKLTLSDGYLMNGKAEKSIKSRQKVGENSAAAANTRWEKERAKLNEYNTPDHATAMRTLCGSDANQKLEARTREEEEANASSVGSGKPNATVSLFAVEEIEARALGAKAKPWDLDADFTALWLGATPEARSRAKSKANVWPHWRAAKAKAGGGAQIVAAMARYRAQDPDVQRTGGPGLHIWLKDGAWDLWMTGEQDVAPVPVASFAGPPGLRAAVVAAKDEDFAVGYLDPCGWEDGPPRRLVARNAYIAEQITKAIGAQLQRAGVEVVTSPTIINEITRERISA